MTSGLGINLEVTSQNWGGFLGRVWSRISPVGVDSGLSGGCSFGRLAGRLLLGRFIDGGWLLVGQ